MDYLNDANIEFWIQNNLNVLLRGKHGCGKTATVLSAFAKAGLTYKYFSAATMDPWTDLCGLPKERSDDDGSAYLDFVLPRLFAEDKVEAIFIDEYNRAPKKIRNAVMELIQFKSINGRKFKNLRMVWAAVNPEEDEVNNYDVEPLDPAQLDRFQVIIDVPYLPSADYFREKFGKELANSAITWWKSLTPQEKDKVSPRRLDYVLDIYQKGGEIRACLPVSINCKQLNEVLRSGPVVSQLKKMVKRNDVAEATEYIRKENNYHTAIESILKEEELLNYFLPLMTNEKITVLMHNNDAVRKKVFTDYQTFSAVIKSLAGGVGRLAKDAQRVVDNHEPIKTSSKPEDKKSFEECVRSALQSDRLKQTADKVNVYRIMQKTYSADLSDEALFNSLQVVSAILDSSQRPTVIKYMPLLPKLAKDIATKAHGSSHLVRCSAGELKTINERIKLVFEKVKQIEDLISGA